MLKNGLAQANTNHLGKIIPVAVLLLMLISLYGSWYTIDQGERGVLLRNGKIIDTAEPGLGFKIPLMDTVVKISTQTHTANYQGLQAYSRDQQPATLRASVTFSIPPDRVEEVYANFKSIDLMVSRLLDRQVPTQIENIFGKYTAISAVQERIDFSNAYEKSVEDRMRAEVEVQTQLQNLEKERVSAQIAVTQAQAEADSQLARAIAEAESIRIKGNAEASAIKIRAEALAQNQNLVELTKAERWDGRLPTTMLPTGTIPFLEVQTTK